MTDSKPTEEAAPPSDASKAQSPVPPPAAEELAKPSEPDEGGEKPQGNGALAAAEASKAAPSPADGGEPSLPYRTFTLWIVPNSVYRRGVRVEVVTPSDEPIATTYLP